MNNKNKDNKPPMTLWVHEKHTEIAALVKPNELMDAFCVGPYVHVGQFIEEVEQEAQACADEGLNYDVAFVDAVRDKVKELKKGTNENT